MFAIYTPAGRTFSGPLERLRRVEKTSYAESTVRVDQMGTDPHTLTENGADGYAISEKAAEQYRTLLPNESQREPVYHAYQIMSPVVRVLLSEWQLRQALEHFDQFPYQVFPIVDSQHQLIGVLSRRELYEYIISSGIPTAKQTQRIADCFLTSDSKVYSVDPVTDIRRITALLVEKNLDALPVVEDTGRIVGIVSRSDILRCATADPPLSLWC